MPPLSQLLWVWNTGEVALLPCCFKTQELEAGCYDHSSHAYGHTRVAGLLLALSVTQIICIVKAHSFKNKTAIPRFLGLLYFFCTENKNYNHKTLPLFNARFSHRHWWESHGTWDYWQCSLGNKYKWKFKNIWLTMRAGDTHRLNCNLMEHECMKA